jgi:hypothetical protein
MATKEQIKKALLETAGNPESGVIYDLADAWADAIVGLDTPAIPSIASTGPAKETRVTKPEDFR